MEKKYHLAIDIGASSGKAIVGYLNESTKKIEYEVIYRFNNGYILKDNHKIWDLTYLFNEVKNTLKVAFKKCKKIETLSIDTWGCDYCLIDKNNKEILPCYSYRDERASFLLDDLFSNIISKREIFKETGSQFQVFNTIFQLYKDKIDNRLKDAVDFLMIPEYLIFKLTGKKIHELSNASTTSLLKKDECDYSKKLIEKLDLPLILFKDKKPKNVGYIVGKLKDDIAKEVNGNLTIKLCPTHDTASVVRYIENELDESSLYLSSGTWSLLGLKLDKYLVNKKVFDNNFSNELGKNYIRFQKNIMGLWIIQNLIKEMNIDILKAIEMAKSSNINDVVIDVNDSSFLSSDNMKNEIISYLKKHDFNDVYSDSDLINIVFVSLAYFYKKSINEIETMLKRKFNKLLVLGGGARNNYLNSLIEKICNIKVIAYPDECSALGNLLSQIED